jgi:acetylornithine deacetylase
MNDVAAVLRDLISIDSVNPDLVPGAKGEAEIAAYVADWLRRAGLDVELQETDRPARRNVIAIARGAGAAPGIARGQSLRAARDAGGTGAAPGIARGPSLRAAGGGGSLLLNSHLDTVGVAGMRDPFVPSVQDGRLYGRGALDTKAALAAFMVAIAGSAGKRRRGDVILTAVVDEEYASAGTEAVARSYKADAAIVGEPTGLSIVTEHKGFVWFECETRGTAAHGSLPSVGVDAIAKMGRVLTAIDAMAARFARTQVHPTLHAGSIHASLIRGGQELSSYPASCLLSIERRTIPGERVEDVEQELRDVLAAAAAFDPTFSATLRRTFARNPLEVPHDLPIVKTLAAQIREATGKEPVYAGMGGWMDSALLADAGIPTVIFGPSGEGLHGESEWVDLESVRTCSRIVQGVIQEFCA